MSIKVSLSSDGLEVYTPPTLKEMCLYKCLTNKQILTKEVEIDETANRTNKIAWEKYRLKLPIPRGLVESLLDAGDKFLFMLTPKYEPVLAAIRMSQPEHLVKVHVSNTDTLEDRQLEWLISGGNVKSLDIHGCESLEDGSLDAINKFGSQLEYLRLGDSSQILPDRPKFNQNESSSILKTPKLKTFVVSAIEFEDASRFVNHYWKFLLKDFVSNLEDLHISNSDLETLGFLEPAKNKLSSLTLSNCVVQKNADSWATLFKLDKLRFLDLIDSSIGEAFSDGNGENVVQRLRIALPNLTQLNIDPGLVRKLGAFAFVRRQSRTKPKRLEFLGTMADVDEMRRGTLLANQVAGFGSTAGELRALEYYADRLNSDYLDSCLEILLERFTTEGKTSVAGAFMLFMKALKNNGIYVIRFESCFEILHKLLTGANVPVKLGDVVVDQFIDFVGVVLRSFPPTPDDFCGYEEGDTSAVPFVVLYTIGIMLKLDRELHFHHYEAVVPTLMDMAETEMCNNVLYALSYYKLYHDWINQIAQLFETTVERFPKLCERTRLIMSILGVMRELTKAMHYDKRLRYEDDLRDSFGSMVSSLKKLCLTSGPCRAAFLAADGVYKMVKIMSDIMDRVLGFNECSCFPMLEILNIVLQDTTQSEVSKTMASELETFLLSLHSEWERRQEWNLMSGPDDNTYYEVMQSVASLLSYLVSDPRFGYEATTAVKEIIVKLK